MKMRFLINSIAAVSLLAVFSCTENIEPEVTPVDQTTPEVKTSKTYSMTITAGKGGMQTKALSVEDHVLSATWTAGDVVTVYNKTKEAALTGELTAAESGASTTLSGDLTGTIEEDDILQLSFLSGDYSTQGGTLEYIAEHCDYAIAEVKVASIDEGKITTTDAADFINQQAIVQFTLKNNSGEASQYVSRLSIGYRSEDLSGSIVITDSQNAVSTNGNGIVYVAFPAVLDATVNLSADFTGQYDCYFYEKAGITFGRGRYYEIGVKMSHVVYITTEENLRSSMNSLSFNNLTLLLKNDIQITGDEIPANFNQTINLNGYTISRSNSGRIFNVTEGTKLTITGGGTITGGSETDGGAIYNSGTLTINDVTISGNTASGHGGAIYNGGILTVNGGTISGNTGNDAGAIYNASGKTLTINGGTFSNNTATTYSGGAVVNEGTATVNGGTFTDNKAQVNGGAIYNYGTLTMTGGEVSGNTAPVGENGNGGGIYIHGNGGDLYMSGNPQIYGNSTNNLYLGQDKVVNVNGKFDTGANISLTPYNAADGTVITSGFSTNNSGTAPQTIFHSDKASYTVKLDSNEGALETYDPTAITGDVPYLNVDGTGDHGTAYCSTYTLMSTLTDNGVTLSGSTTNGWYVVDKNLTFNKRITISGTVNLLLVDNTQLTANKGIFVPKNSTLHIYAQSNKMTDPNDMMGGISATANDNYYSGLGGTSGTYGSGGEAGVIHIHGGFITAVGGLLAAGIYTQPALNEVYTLFIYGGFVFGGGGQYGAGIGGCFQNMCPSMKITGGTVYGVGGAQAAGIGSGYAGRCHGAEGNGPSYSYNPGYDKTFILITGGDVNGVGVTGAGIGGGEGKNVYDGDPAMVYVRGGRVSAYTMSDYSPLTQSGPQMRGANAIGWGEFGMSMKDYLEIYDGLRVLATEEDGGTKTLQTYANSRNYDKYKKYKDITIEPCTEHVYENGKCKYCNHPQ